MGRVRRAPTNADDGYRLIVLLNGSKSEFLHIPTLSRPYGPLRLVRHLIGSAECTAAEIEIALGQRFPFNRISGVVCFFPRAWLLLGARCGVFMPPSSEARRNNTLREIDHHRAAVGGAM